jgi:hypothetical protein
MKHSQSSLPRDQFALGALSVLQVAPDEYEDGGSEILLQVGEELFPNDETKVMSFVSRFFALLEVLDSTEFDPWLGEGAGGKVYVHPALLSAAAMTRLNKNGRFPQRILREAVHKLEQEEFPDWEWPAGEE